MDIVFQQLPQQVQTAFSTMSMWFWLDGASFFFIILACIGYLVILLVLIQIHQKIIQYREKALENYTFAVDSLIYESQKAVANWSQDPASCEWISNRDAKKSYTSEYSQLQTIAELFPETSGLLKKTHSKYQLQKNTETIRGSVLVIITLGAYKLFW